jgi:hypothetical protein
MKKQLLPIVMIMILLVGLAATGCAQTPKEEPKKSISIGTWVNSQKIAEADNKAHQMKYQIDSIIRDPKKVAAAIKVYNLSGTGNLIGKLESDNLQFCIAKYSAVYPKSFPQKVFGITDVAVPFEIVSLTGGEIQVKDTIYKNIATTWETGSLPQGYDFHAGDTYHGQIVFIMVKGYKDYLIHEVKKSTAASDQTYIKGE